MADATSEYLHRSVMPDEVKSLFEPLDGKLIVDATLGLGGHSEMFLNAAENSRVIGIDQDIEALDLAKVRLAKFGSRGATRQANFADIKAVIGPEQPDGILADLGVSSLQLDSESRGFSFRYDAPLDMRMDATSDRQSAAELLETIDQEGLANLIYLYGEERHSRKIARWIVENRERGEPVTTTTQLAELVRRAVPRGKDKIHPATRTFQALRIAVNGELDILDGFISDSIDILKTDGVLAIITFHSLEDRIVKHTFQRLSGKCSCPPRMPQCMCGAEKRVEIVTRKPIVPSEEEQNENPRSRSAKLRACRKI